MPENVIPIVKTSNRINCEFPNGHVQTINREQVDILLNFAMTDYASQGRIRPINVVDLTDCRSHFSYYTCLSRSVSVEGVTTWSHKGMRDTEAWFRCEGFRCKGFGRAWLQLMCCVLLNCTCSYFRTGHKSKGSAYRGRS